MEEPIAEPAEPQSYSAQDDGDLIRRIEALRQQNGDDSEELIDEIQNLLDGLE